MWGFLRDLSPICAKRPSNSRGAVTIWQKSRAKPCLIHQFRSGDLFDVADPWRRPGDFGLQCLEQDDRTGLAHLHIGSAVEIGRASCRERVEVAVGGGA